MSTIKASNLQHASAASAAIVLAADGSAAAQLSSINGGPLAGFRNAIINGNFDFWRRGTTNSSAISGYLADRFRVVSNGTTVSQSRQSFTLGQTDVPGEPEYFWRGVVTSVAGASNFAILRQSIEGVRTFAGQPAMLSFWAKGLNLSNISVELVQNFGTSGASNPVNGIGTAKFALTSSWQKFTVPVTFPSIADKTVTSENHVQLNFWLDAGSNFNSRSSSLGQQTGTVDIAQIQLEPGITASPFETRHYAQELALCSRYLLTFPSYAIGKCTSISTVRFFHTYAEMRPSIQWALGTGSIVVTDGSTLFQANTAVLGSASFGVTGGSFDVSGFANLTTGAIVALASGSASLFIFSEYF